MEVTEIQKPELVLLQITLRTTYAIVYHTVRGAVNVVRLTAYLTRRHAKLMRAELPYMAHILKGGKVLVMDDQPAHVNKYHTRYENSVRGHQNDDTYSLSVKAGA